MNWPTFVTAVGTTSLSLVGAATWLQNRSLVKAARQEASASAALIAETVRDRDLRWEPWLSVRWPESIVGSGGRHDIEITNAGGGPALTCRLVVKQDGQDGWLTPAVDIPVGHTVNLRADQVVDGAVASELSTWLGDDGFNHNVESLGAIFAKDVLGTRFRFLVVKDGSSRAIVEHRERWRLNDDPGPSWSKNRVIWPDYGVPNP